MTLLFAIGEEGPFEVLRVVNECGVDPTFAHRADDFFDGIGKETLRRLK